MKKTYEKPSIAKSNKLQVIAAAPLSWEGPAT
ncbi:hypothetical protein ABIE08_003831 [Kaistia defluvii]|uniref:RiPP n=1 Tax=Kaistia defluvii TaxID=410841 RepID=A0ABV2R3Q7_9HYPH